MTFTKCLILEIRHALSITHSVPFILQGNLNWMRSREATIQSPVWRGRENEIRPFGDPKASDSANLDNAAEVRDSAPFINYTKHAFLVFLSAQPCHSHDFAFLSVLEYS
jgi:glutamate synthase domain-containing protein 1